MEHKIPRVGPLGLLAGVAGEVAATSRAAWSAGTGRTERPRPDAAPSGSLRQDAARGESLKPDAAPSGPARQDMAGERGADLDVIVIGAGVAGLSAARVLADAGKRVVVVEARDRIGGRMWTHPDAMSVPIELGAQFIHGRNASTWELVRQQGLRTHTHSHHVLPYAAGRPVEEERPSEFPYNFQVIGGYNQILAPSPTSCPSSSTRWCDAWSTRPAGVVVHAEQRGAPGHLPGPCRGGGPARRRTERRRRRVLPAAAEGEGGRLQGRAAGRDLQGRHGVRPGRCSRTMPTTSSKPAGRGG